MSISLITRNISLRGKAVVGLAISAFCLVFPALAQEAPPQSKQAREKATAQATLWHDPTDLESRDLYYGPGGKQDAPGGTVFTYEKEVLKGTNPKFDVRDPDGVRWRVKLGPEAQPETVAARLLWAVGYFTDEDYFLPEIQVRGMQPVSKKRQKRIQGLLESDGTMHNVRLKRHVLKKVGVWQWKRDPFAGTREWNGLRVMMALMNNWDLKDENNSIYAAKEHHNPQELRSSDSELLYVVSDLGASFGTAGRVRDPAIAKGNLESYRRSRFICGIHPQYVDFCVPARESWVLAVNPKEYTGRLKLRWIGRHIPRSDVRWIGQLLARLSPGQIQDAFRAAGYSPQQVDAFSQVLLQRIAELNDL
jgi:hypothetical protein